VTGPADPQLGALAALIGRVAQLLAGGDDPAARRAAAVNVEELRAAVAQAGQGGPVAGFDLAQIGAALAVFAEWLRTPSRDTEVRAERAMSELQTALGPLVGWDPAREDAARREQYRREARAALDEIFPDKPEKR
jgi:hypothetical protein